MSDERTAIVALFGLVVGLVIWLLYSLSDKERKLHKARNLQQTALNRAALEQRGVVMPDNVGELNAEIAGQKFSLKDAPVNTIATLATLLLVVLIAYAFYTHQQDTKESGQGFVAALKEQTTAMKEQTTVLREANCLTAYQGPVQDKERFCKSVTR